MSVMSEKGFYIGCKVRVVNACTGNGYGFKNGDILTLAKDTGTTTLKYTSDSYPGGPAEYMHAREIELISNPEVVMNNTPATRMGLQIGDRVVTTSTNSRKIAGTYATLLKDDGTGTPYFIVESGVYKGMVSSLHLEYVKKVDKVVPKTKTPFENTGWNKDAILKVVCGNSVFATGDLVKLYYDDGSVNPEFISETSGMTAYCYLDRLEEYKPTIMEQKGYKIGDKFVVIGNTRIGHFYTLGSIVDLASDLGTYGGFTKQGFNEQQISWEDVIPVKDHYLANQGISIGDAVVVIKDTCGFQAGTVGILEDTEYFKYIKATKHSSTIQVRGNNNKFENAEGGEPGARIDAGYIRKASPQEVRAYLGKLGKYGYLDRELLKFIK